MENDASRRTFAAGDAGTAARCRRQQRRERQHHRLQGRQLAVRGISELGRARRQFRRQRPPRQLRAGPRHLPRFCARRRRADQESARCRDRRRRLPGGADPGRRALHPRRRPADQQQGQLVTAAGNPVLGTTGPIVFQPTDHDINIAADGTITVLEGTNRIDSVRGKLRLVSFAQAQKLLKEGSNLYSAGEGAAAQPDTDLAGAPGLYREIQRQFGGRDEPHDRGDARLHADLDDAAAAKRPAQNRDRKTRRRSGVRPFQD